MHDSDGSEALQCDIFLLTTPKTGVILITIRRYGSSRTPISEVPQVLWSAVETSLSLIFDTPSLEDARMRLFRRSGSTDPARVKPPNVAGMFYSGDGEALRREVDAHLGRARAEGPAPKAIIAPHAGYRYSGPIAASAYARLKPRAHEIRRVVLLGPTHYHPIRGVAVSTAESFLTPLGRVPVDIASVGRALEFAFVHRLDPAFEREHSLEVHLPFLMRVLPGFTVVPLLVGTASPTEIDTLLEALWGGPETAIVISSDLSHYLDYESARRLDAETSDAIVALRHDAVGYEQACGRHAVNGLLHLAKRRGLEAKALDVRNSGDTAGSPDRVVGYGAYAFFEPALDVLSLEARRHLLGIAARSVRHGIAHGKESEVVLDRLPPALRERRATFVTLESNRRLRGCIGSLEATRPLAEDVAHNAHAAAFADPRFSPIEESELEGLGIKISVLSPPVPMQVESEADLVSRLSPGIDGLIIQDGKKRATFLPSVWRGIPEPERFVRELVKKAGWPAGHWSGTVRAWRYTTEEFD